MIKLDVLTVNQLCCCLSSGVLPALLWRCWPRNLHGPSSRPWQPFLRLPPSLRSPCFPRACPTRAGTSCGRCSWRRSGGRLQTVCSATHLSRAASESRGPPSPPLPARPPWPRYLPSSPARPVPRAPCPPAPRPRHQAPGLSITPTPCPVIYHQCLPCQDPCVSHQLAQPGEARLSAVRVLQGIEVCSPRRGLTRKHLAVSQATDCCPFNKSRKSDPS